MKRIGILICSILFAFFLVACTESTDTPSTTPTLVNSTQSAIIDITTAVGDNVPSLEKEVSEFLILEENTIRTIQVTVGNKIFSAVLEENEAVNAFVQLIETEPIVINMSDYSGFEKVGSLGTDLPTSNKQITTQSGDIVLYNGNQIVAFYGSNSWSYTKLGKINDLSGWKEALGNGDVTITFSIS